MSDKRKFSVREINLIEPGKEILKDGLFIESRKSDGELRWGVRYKDAQTQRLKRRLIGSFDDVTQSEAREIANRVRQHGSDSFRYTTFMDVMNELSEVKEWSAKYKAKSVQSINTRFHQLANHEPVSEFVSRSGDVLEQLSTELDEIRSKNGKGVMYLRVVKLVNRVIERAYAFGLVTSNPYRSAVAEMPKIESERHAAPMENSLTDIWNDLDAIHKPNVVVKARAVKLAMLTGLRSVNVLGMEWQDIKPATKDEIAHIHISKAKSKNRLGFTVPITPEVQRIIDEQRAICPLDSTFVFNSSKGTSFKANLGALVNELGIGPKYSTTAHGFRSAYITKLNQIGAPEFLIKKSIGHNAYSASLMPYDYSSHLEQRYSLQFYYENFIKGKKPPKPTSFL
ncbi:tyrosine-type recombinase/integrase [Vibrio barjaei]|uniref:tyrosine-type recombinase/integrase n=1 Tax=Vibrio barjaei TaxID=1676683 RepID=UPI0022846DF9|nr:tyrosine-type recombinase/integrase [Vibrio barjaei]MCY9873212.1 tyrosine-type recombinase/integrase [Vibrio barjaei]